MIRLFLLLLLLVVCISKTTSYELERFEFEGNSHFAFGYTLGAKFQTKIQARIGQHVQLQNRLLPFYYQTEEGKELYQKFLTIHRRIFPEYLEELLGIASGSNVPFETIFILNLSEEYGDAIPSTFEPIFAMKTLKCSDIVLYGEKTHMVVHNEDSSFSDVNHTALVIAKIGHTPRFVGYTYLGDLPTGAIGYNDHGIGFTLNFVQPSETEIGGLGRGFISRDLLTATNLKDAMDKITRPNQAAGHNYQLMEFNSKKIFNIEVASFNRFTIKELFVLQDQVQAFFHANQYQTLYVSQPEYPSSIHRLKRYSELKTPSNLQQALEILGDQEDHLYPIFHDEKSHARGELSGWTLFTIAFDLDKAIAYSYEGNPAKANIHLIWDLTNPSNITTIDT